ncbi:benzoate/H(+) symporter BenE family transporter [Corynebacterium hindlerae]|uniref:benzoate/H(+) symporter BenE family transporter n=1 Tax=Corynebacterium hindlerae TaxID=699041 RepID=UPI001AD7A06D|nr:benzoate/H(+) symporter BenE family transporter [Corynebacterium hindlerae]QTH59720.1 benzoate/H(+) symporter BenE family transporter [Corynebacterium hindlerae]
MPQLLPLLAVEKPTLPRPSWQDFRRDLGIGELGAGLVALLFSASGAIAVILQAAAAGGLDNNQISSWIFGAFFGNGILTLLLTYLYRSPQAYFWTIPGTVLVGDALTHLSFAEVIGAYLATGVLVFLLGWSGLIGRVMAVLPPTIVMAMVAGIFLRFGLDLVNAGREEPLLALPMIAVFIALSALPNLGRFTPPVAMVAIIGTVLAFSTGSFSSGALAGGWIAKPLLYQPEFSTPAMIELVIPLAITVVIVQNGQGTAVLAASGHHQDPNLSAAASGIWSLFVGLLGTSSTCLTGPTNAIICSAPDRRRHYAAALVTGIGAVIVGVLAPALVGFMVAMPKAFIATLAGVAMLVPLKNAFVAAFSGAATTGALVCFLVTVSNLTLLGITAPFWGLVFGCMCAAALDR